MSTLKDLSTLLVKAKFYYAIWSQIGSKLVADLQLVLDDRPNFCSLQVCNQLQTCLRPDSVMEFGLYDAFHALTSARYRDLVQ